MFGFGVEGLPWVEMFAAYRLRDVTLGGGRWGLYMGVVS